MLANISHHELPVLPHKDNKKMIHLEFKSPQVQLSGEQTISIVLDKELKCEVFKSVLVNTFGT